MDPGARNGLLNFESMQMTLLFLSPQYYRTNSSEEKNDFKLGQKIKDGIFNIFWKLQSLL